MPYMVLPNAYNIGNISAGYDKDGRNLYLARSVDAALVFNQPGYYVEEDKKLYIHQGGVASSENMDLLICGKYACTYTNINFL